MSLTATPETAPEIDSAPTPVRIGDSVFGGTRLPVLAGPTAGGDVVRWSMRRYHGAARARSELERVRDLSASTLVVEPFAATDLDAVGHFADGVLVGAAWMQDFRLLAAVGRLGLPVVMQRGQYVTVAEWLSAVEYLTAEGCTEIVLCETGCRTHLTLSRSTVDLALVREVRTRSGRPVVVDVSPTPQLAGAAIAAGADGVLLAENAEPSEVAAAIEAVTLLTPLVRPVEPEGVAGCREAIDRVDATLATLLEYRAGLSAAVQRWKPVSGHAGRDEQREREIARRMASRAPRLGAERLARVVDVVITTGLDLAEESDGAADRSTG